MITNNLSVLCSSNRASPTRHAEVPPMPLGPLYVFSYNVLPSYITSQGSTVMSMARVDDIEGLLGSPSLMLVSKDWAEVSEVEAKPRTMSGSRHQAGPPGHGREDGVPGGDLPPLPDRQGP